MAGNKIRSNKKFNTLFVQNVNYLRKLAKWWVKCGTVGDAVSTVLYVKNTFLF